MVLGRDVNDLIEKAQDEISATDLTHGKRLQGGGMPPNTPNPYRGEKMRGGSYYVNPRRLVDDSEGLPGPTPNNPHDFRHDFDNALKSLYNDHR